MIIIALVAMPYFFGGNLISCSSHKHPTVSRSKAKYKVVADANTEII